MARLQILRAGTPGPSADRWATSFLLEIGEDLLMIDCGHCATQRLIETGRQPKDVTHLFITHHHSDHVVDYPALFLSRWNQSTHADPPLRVFGPAPIRQMTERLFGEDGVFREDIAARINHPASHQSHTRRGGELPRPAPALEARDVHPGAAVGGDAWTARCVEVQHMQPWMTCLAWRFDWEGGSCAFTGDAAPGQPLTDLMAGVDTLVANVVVRQEQLTEVMGSCILGTIDAAEVARDAGAKRLVPAHLTPGLFRERERATAEMAEVFDGEIIFSEERMTVPV